MPTSYFAGLFYCECVDYVTLSVEKLKFLATLTYQVVLESTKGFRTVLAFSSFRSVLDRPTFFLVHCKKARQRINSQKIPYFLILVLVR